MAGFRGVAETLGQSDFGQGKAEKDIELQEAFIETDLWTDIVRGRGDVIFGGKGSGKSTIKAGLISMRDPLRRRRIELIEAKRPDGRVWKLYVLDLVCDRLAAMGVDDPLIARVRSARRETKVSALPVHRLLAAVATVLLRRRLTCWVVVDAEGLALDAFRSLIETYLDLLGSRNQICLKIFVDEYTWRRVRADSVLSRHIGWSHEDLYRVMALRLSSNRAICRKYRVSHWIVKRSRRLQAELSSRALFHRAEEILSALRDGKGQVFPSDLVRLLAAAKEIQLDRCNMGLAAFEADELFEQQTIEAALIRVSQERLSNVLLTEHPQLAIAIFHLRGSTITQTPEDLAQLWRQPLTVAVALTRKLKRIGFFMQQDGPHQVAPVYQRALALVAP